MLVQPRVVIDILAILGPRLCKLAKMMSHLSSVTMLTLSLDIDKELRGV